MDGMGDRRERARVERIRASVFLSARGSVYWWLYHHHDEFLETLARRRISGGRPNWDGIAKEMGRGGLRTRLGDYPGAESTRQTWLKVQRRVASERAGEVEAEVYFDTDPHVMAAQRAGRDLIEGASK